MNKLLIPLALAGCLAGCAPQQQQTAIPPSPTGCYYREPTPHGLLGLLQPGPRYTPAPCNVVNANQRVVTGTGESGMVSVGGGATPGDQTVIRASDCIGPVVMGVCHGAPAPMAPTATCHGQMVGGVCTGPQF